MKNSTFISGSKNVISAIRSKSRLFAGVFMGLSLAIAGCSENSSVNPFNGNENLTNISTSDMGDPANTRHNMFMSIRTDYDSRGNSPIKITEAKALISQAELSSDASRVNYTIQKVPFVTNFTGSGSLVTVTSGNLPAGKFSKIRFNIYRPGSTEPIPDPEFREGQGTERRYSFIIKGTYKGNDFVYRSTSSSIMDIDLSSPVFTGSKTRNITIMVNASQWFKGTKGYLDPSDSANSMIIDESIKYSFLKAFNDDNKDGLPD